MFPVSILSIRYAHADVKASTATLINQSNAPINIEETNTRCMNEGKTKAKTNKSFRLSLSDNTYLKILVLKLKINRG